MADSLYDDLVKHRLIIPTGVPGAFGRGAVLEDVLHRFNALLSRTVAGDGAEVMVFPPTLDRKLIEKSEYIDSFPQLAGSIFSFTGNDRDHIALKEAIHAGRPWAQWQTMTELVLAPAACYPVYPTFTGTISEKGHLVDIQNWVFRHEPSPEPTRMQSFRMREFVRIGTQDAVVAWRDAWHERGLELLRSLGLPAKSDVATDPFFGRSGRMLVGNQLEQKLKFEGLVPVISETQPTAVCSFNYHQDHFGQLFALKLPGGGVAQTGCVAFGLERCTMALFKTHGMDPKSWPESVRIKLWG